jgi:hypothetical protein
MRLLHTTKHTLHEFYGDDVPFYAILSHRWETDEVTIEDLRLGTLKLRKGYGKIMGCCERARADGWEFVVCVILACLSFMGSWGRGYGNQERF